MVLPGEGQRPWHHPPGHAEIKQSHNQNQQGNLKHRAQNRPDPWGQERGWEEPQCSRPWAALDRGALSPCQNWHLEEAGGYGGVTAPPQSTGCNGGVTAPPPERRLRDSPFTEGSRLQGKAETLARPQHCQAALWQSAGAAPRSLLAQPQRQGQRQMGKKTYM